MKRLIEWWRGEGRMTAGSLGASGEKLAEKWLRRRGFHILDRNFTIAGDEIDLLALDPDARTVVVIEVKTRSSAAPALPEESVGAVKRHRLARIAGRLAQSKRYEGRPIRFDVIAIVWPERGEAEIRHIPAAFESPF